VSPPTPKGKTPARRSSTPARRSSTPARRTAASAAASGSPNVALQATFVYGTAPNEKEITLNTQDLSNLAPGKIQFHLDQPVELGNLTEFLAWASSTFTFPKPDPTQWPQPFAGLAQVNVTINKLDIDQVNGNYGLDVTMAPPTPVKLPIVNIAIKEIGVAITKTASTAG
jgi:hypothetical protein